MTAFWSVLIKCNYWLEWYEYPDDVFFALSACIGNFGIINSFKGNIEKCTKFNSHQLPHNCATLAERTTPGFASQNFVSKIKQKPDLCGCFTMVLYSVSVHMYFLYDLIQVVSWGQW